MVAGLSVVPFPGGRKCRPGHWNRTVVQLIHSYLVPSQSTVVQCGVFGAGGFSSALTLAPLIVSWAIEKTATMIAYGANALMTSTAESPSGRPCLRTYAGSSTAPPATGTGSGLPVSNCSCSRGFQTRVSNRTAVTEISAA